MRVRPVRALLAAAVATTSVVIPVSAAVAADPGPGTYTRITTPSGPSYTLTSLKTFTVAGEASTDVTSVDLVCVSTSLSGTIATPLATDVPVSGGNFAATASPQTINGACRLRAIPSGTDATSSYLGSYAGPRFNYRVFVAPAQAFIPGTWLLADSRGDGVVVASSPGNCQTAMETVESPSLLTHGGQFCSFGLPAQNVSGGATPTASSVVVDGRNAYLPGAVASLNGAYALGLPQPKLTATLTRAANGDPTVTESATLMRCSVSNTYPPTTTSCPKLVSTGVVFTRLTSLVLGDHQIRVRDVFTSTGSKHAVTLQYVGYFATPATGGLGYVVPGHGKAFVAEPAKTVLTGLGTKAATVLVRSDRFATADDPAAYTFGLTWAKAPRSMRFGAVTANLPTPDQGVGMSYSLSVPAKGSVRLGFATSEQLTTAAVEPLGASAIAAAISAPTITSPSNGAHVKGTKTVVKGTVVAGANGLPVSVSVNGHMATVTRTGATTASWNVTFTGTYARHTLKATSTDNAGNAAAKSIIIRNVKP